MSVMFAQLCCVDVSHDIITLGDMVCFKVDRHWLMMVALANIQLAFIDWGLLPECGSRGLGQHCNLTFLGFIVFGFDTFILCLQQLYNSKQEAAMEKAILLM